MRVMRRLLGLAVWLWVVTAPGAWANHSTDDVNCDAFATRAEALAYLAQHPGDPDRLDADNDGIPCENLPAGGGGGGPTTTVQPIDLSCDVIIVEPDGTLRVPPGCPPVTTTTTTQRQGTTTTMLALREPLARTGSEDGPLMALSGLLVVTGAALVALSRVRRSTT